MGHGLFGGDSGSRNDHLQAGNRERLGTELSAGAYSPLFELAVVARGNGPSETSTPRSLTSLIAMETALADFGHSSSSASSAGPLRLITGDSIGGIGVFDWDWSAGSKIHHRFSVVADDSSATQQQRGVAEE